MNSSEMISTLQWTRLVEKLSFPLTQTNTDGVDYGRLAGAVVTDDHVEARGWLDGLVVVVHEVLHPQTDDTAGPELSLTGHLSLSAFLNLELSLE